MCNELYFKRFHLKAIYKCAQTPARVCSYSPSFVLDGKNTLFKNSLSMEDLFILLALKIEYIKP